MIQRSNHHVIFLVDEIGQYIGDSRDLMLNLQTVVEDLGTACGGKCFVIVTSQEGLDEFAVVKGLIFQKFKEDSIQDYLFHLQMLMKLLKSVSLEKKKMLQVI